MKTSFKKNKSFKNLTTTQLTMIKGGFVDPIEDDFDSEVNTVRTQINNSTQKKEVTKPTN